MLFRSSSIDDHGNDSATASSVDNHGGAGHGADDTATSVTTPDSVTVSPVDDGNTGGGSNGGNGSSKP